MEHGQLSKEWCPPLITSFVNAMFFSYIANVDAWEIARNRFAYIGSSANIASSKVPMNHLAFTVSVIMVPVLLYAARLVFLQTMLRRDPSGHVWRRASIDRVFSFAGTMFTQFCLFASIHLLSAIWCVPSSSVPVHDACWWSDVRCLFGNGHGEFWCVVLFEYCQSLSSFSLRAPVCLAFNL